MLHTGIPGKPLSPGNPPKPGGPTLPGLPTINQDEITQTQTIVCYFYCGKRDGYNERLQILQIITATICIPAAPAGPI